MIDAGYFHVATRDGGTQEVPGVRLHPLFAWTHHIGAFGTIGDAPVSVTHLPTGFRAGVAADIRSARRVVRELIACDFVDWNEASIVKFEKAYARLTEAQKRRLRAASMANAQTEVTHG